jgi:Tol biopolymer transport system component/tRNA A-37 threonylcarbamoyl transferase component Bud32
LSDVAFRAIGFDVLLCAFFVFSMFEPDAARRGATRREGWSEAGQFVIFGAMTRDASRPAEPYTPTVALAKHYRVERELGAGGMATVYLAEDLKHHRKVAVKVLRRDLAESLGAERFLREIRIAAQLQHPHIVGLLDSGEVDGSLYYVMPYVEGETLRARLEREKRLSPSDTARVLAEVADALAYAHERGIVHRDIKPENVMFSGRHAVVADFGIARALAAGTAEHGAAGGERRTTHGVALGTPAYMSPEQAAADPGVDHRADIYALGVIGYELLAGEPPFRGPSQQVLMAHVTQTPTPLAERRPDVNAPLRDTIMRCLAKRPDERWPTAEALGAALESTITPSGGHPPTAALPAAQPSAGRRRLARRIAAAGTIVVAAAVIATLANRSRPLAVVSTAQITSDAGLYLDPALSPDGKLLAYAAGPPSAMRIYVQQLGGGRSLPLAPDEPGDQRWPQWSPDGQRIAFASDGGVDVVPALGGKPRRIATFSNGYFASPTWSPDGRRIAYSDSAGVQIADIETGRMVRVAKIPQIPGQYVGANYFDLQWSPNGRWIAASSGNGEFAFAKNDLGNVLASRIWLLPTDGGSGVMLPSDSSALEISPVWLPDSRHLLFVSTRGGGRDVYEVSVTRDGQFDRSPTRLTTGLQAHSIALAADSHELAYSSYTPSAGVWTIDLSRTGPVSSRTAIQLTHGTDIIEETALSPDGRSLLITANRSGHSNVYALPIDGGPAVQLTFDTTDVFDIGWSRTGREVFFLRTGSEYGLYTMPSAGGPAEEVPNSGNNYRRPAWSPVANVLLFTYGADRKQPLATIERTAEKWSAPRVIAGTENAQYPTWSPDGRSIAYLTRTGAASGAPLDALAIIPSEGGTPRVLVSASGNLVELDRPIWGDDRQTIYYRAVDANGRISLWSVAASGGTPRELVTFDDPDRPGSLRTHYAIVNGRLYTRIMQHRSVLGIAKLAAR